MGYLLHVFLAIAVLAIGDERLISPIAPAGFGFTLFVVPYLLARAGRKAASLGHFRGADRLFLPLHLWGPVAFALAGLAFGWIEWIGIQTGKSGRTTWPDVTTFVTLLPFALFQLAGIDARGRAIGLDRLKFRRWRSFQLRMFGSALVPFALYVGICALVALSEPLRVYIERVGLANAAFVLAMAAVLMTLLPRILENTWETEPLPRNFQRELLDAVASEAKFRARSLLVWHTGYAAPNAVIVGLMPSSRVVFFSDALLHSLSPRELAAVFAHEIGHAKRHHVMLFLAWAVAFIGGGDLLIHTVEPSAAWVVEATLFAVIAGWLLVFGWLSRRFELEADLYSVDLFGDTDALVSALERVGGRADDRSGWRHFSTAERVRFLRRARDDPKFSASFQRKLRRLRRLGIALAVTVAALQLNRLTRDAPIDRVFAELSLGRYQRAHELAASAEVDEDLAQLCEVALGLRPEGTDASPVALETILAQLSDTLAGEPDSEGAVRALQLTRLAGMRGKPELFEWADVLAEALDDLDSDADDPRTGPEPTPDELTDEALARLSEVYPEWRRALSAGTP